MVSVVALYRAAHSVVCYSVHQATTDLLENRPVILVLIVTPAIPGGLGQVLDVVELVVLVALQTVNIVSSSRFSHMLLKA